MPLEDALTTCGGSGRVICASLPYLRFGQSLLAPLFAVCCGDNAAQRMVDFALLGVLSRLDGSLSQTVARRRVCFRATPSLTFRKRCRKRPHKLLNSEQSGVELGRRPLIRSPRASKRVDDIVVGCCGGAADHSTKRSQHCERGFEIATGRIVTGPKSGCRADLGFCCACGEAGELANSQGATEGCRK